MGYSSGRGWDPYGYSAALDRGRASSAIAWRSAGSRCKTAPSSATFRRNHAFAQVLVIRPDGDMTRLGRKRGDVLVPPCRPASSGEALPVQLVGNLAQRVPRRT